jgi:hypothetical protein
MGRSKRFNRNNVVIFLFLCFFIRLSMSENQQQVNAQTIPLPPPIIEPKATPSHLEPSQAKNDTSSSPIIEFLTNSLIEGKNVLKIKIIDKSDLKYAEIRYVHNGNVVTQGLVRDQNSVYKALIDVRSPAAMIIINAADINGQRASVIKELNVTSLANNIIGQISNLLYDFGKIIVSIFVPTRR